MVDPVVPALNLGEAVADATAAIDKKKSFGKKIASSFKKAMSTPRTGSSGNLDAVAAAAENGVADVTSAVNSAATAAKGAATDAAAAAKSEASRLGKAAEAANGDVVSAAKKATEGENKAPALLAVGALVAIVAVVLTAVAGNKKKPVPVAPKKKGLW